jgi:hypothetical protein
MFCYSFSTPRSRAAPQQRVAVASPVWRVSPAAWVLILPAIGAEALSNALRAYGLGAHLQQFSITVHGHPVSLAGGVLVLAAVAVSLSQARTAWIALTPGSLRQRIVCGLGAVLLLAISITAMVGLILEAQRAKAGDEGTDRAAYDRASAEYLAAKADYDLIADARPAEVIDQAIRSETAAILADDERRPLWRRSAQCTNITKGDSAKACATVILLRKELAAANNRPAIEQRYRQAGAALQGLSRPEHATAQELQVGGVWAWLAGFGVVFMATFGTVIFARVETANYSKHSNSSALPDQQPDSPPSPSAPAPSSGPVPGLVGPKKPDRKPDADPKAGPDCARKPDRHLSPAPSPAGTGPGPGRKARKDAALADLLTRLALGEWFGSQDELASRYRVPKSTMSDWLREWEAAGLIPERRTVGRFKQVEL